MIIQSIHNITKFGTAKILIEQVLDKMHFIVGSLNSFIHELTVIYVHRCQELRLTESIF